MSKFWNEKFLGISSFYTCVPKVQSYDRIFGHFGPFFALLTPYPCILLPYQDRIRALFEIATAFGHTIILRLRSNTLVSCMNQVLQTNNVATRWYLPLSLFNLNYFLQFRVIDVFFFFLLVPSLWPNTQKSSAAFELMNFIRDHVQYQLRPKTIKCLLSTSFMRKRVISSANNYLFLKNIYIYRPLIM